MSFKLFNKKIDFIEKDKEIKSFVKQFKYTSIDNMNNLVDQYLSFYQDYMKQLSKAFSNNQSKEVYLHFVRINILYNEVYNYGYLMLNRSAYEAYESQKNFINNTMFNNILQTKINQENARQIVLSSKMKAILSILCHKSKQDIFKQSIEHDMFNYYHDVLSDIYTSPNKNNRRLFLLCEALNRFIDKDKEMSAIKIGHLFNLDKKEYAEKLHELPLQYIGLGTNPYITACLPDDFKQFINEQMMNRYQSKKELNEMELDYFKNLENSVKIEQLM